MFLYNCSDVFHEPSYQHSHEWWHSFTLLSLTCGVVLLLTGGQDQARPGDRAGPKDPSGVNEEEEEQDAGTDSAYSTTGSTATSVHVHHSDDAETNDGNSDKRSISSGTVSPMLTEAGFGQHSESSPEAHLSEPGTQGGQAEPAAAAEQAQGEDCNDSAGESQDLAAVTPHGHQTAVEETAEGFGRESKSRGSGGPSEEENHNRREPTLDTMQDLSKQTPGEEESLLNEVSAPHADEVEHKVDKPLERAVKPPEECSIPSLEEQVAEVEKLRSPEQELPYTLQRYFLVDDSASDTLSIISERTEPGDNEDDMDEGEGRDALPNDDSDSEGTVHDDLDGHWSDDSNDVLECAGTTTPTKVSASGETAELLASLQQQLESEEKQPEPKQTEGSPACEEHLPAVSRDLGDEGDISENPQVVQQTGKLPEGALLEVSSTQAEVLPICRDELEEVQDLIAQADQKAVILSRHILQEDSSTTAEQVLPVTIGKDNQDQVQDWLTEQEERRPQPLKPFSEDETQEAASLPRNQHHHSEDQSVVLPGLPGRQSGTVSTGAMTSSAPHELAEGQDSKESDELDLAKKRAKSGQADSCDSGESGREDCSPDLSEGKVSLHGEPADAEAGKFSVARKAEAVLASSPVDVSIHKEAVFLDGGWGCRRVSAHGAGGGGGDGECFICKAVCSEGKMHAVNADWPDVELQGRSMSDSEKTGRGDAGTENVSNGAGSCPTNMPVFAEALLVNTNTDNVPKPVGEGREDAAPENRGLLQKTSSATSGHHLTSAQTRHDSDRDSTKGSATFHTEDKLSLRRELCAEGSQRSLPNDYLPEAEVDLDDPCLYPATTVAAVWDSVGGGASPGLPNDRGLGARDGEVVSQFSVPARGSAGEVASSPSSGTTTRLSIVALGGDDFVPCFHYTLLFCFSPWQRFLRTLALLTDQVLLDAFFFSSLSIT